MPYVYATGSCNHGQLGTGRLLASRPTVIPRVVGLDDVNVTAVSAGQFHSAAITDEGALYTWGLGKAGRLGLEDTEDRTVPSFVKFFKNQKVVHVSCGGEHTLCCTDDGMCYAFGEGFNGQLGKQDLLFCIRPETPRGLEQVKIRKVAAGVECSAAICEDGRLYTWGNGQRGVLGHGTTEDVKLPLAIASLSDCKIVDMAMSLNHALAVTESGKVLSWGGGPHGQLGLGGKKTLVLAPTLVSGMPDPVVHVSVGLMHSMAVLSTGALYGWGVCSEGQCGLGIESAHYSPRLVTFRDGDEISEIRCGPHYTLCISERGLYGFGSSVSGQLGNCDTKTRYHPWRSKSFADTGIIAISAGTDHAIIVTELPLVKSSDDIEATDQSPKAESMGGPKSARGGDVQSQVSATNLILNDETLGRTNTSGCASILVPTPRDLTPRTQLSDWPRPSPRASVQNGVMYFDGKSVAGKIPAVLNFTSWFLEDNKRKNIRIDFYTEESVFQVQVSDREEVYTIAIRNRQGFLLQEWDLYVGLTLDILGRPTCLKQAGGETMAWLDFHARRLLKQKTLIEKVLGKFCVFGYSESRGSRENENIKNPASKRGGYINLRKLMNEIDDLEKMLAKYKNPA